MSLQQSPFAATTPHTMSFLRFEPLQLGDAVGSGVGDAVGLAVVGAAVGDRVGDMVGNAVVGAAVGDTVG